MEPLKDKLEKVQQRQRATKIECLKAYNYEETLSKMGLTSLEDRRRRGDLIKMFKYFKGQGKINYHRPLELINNDRKTREHDKKIRRQLTDCTRRHNFLANMVLIK